MELRVLQYFLAVAREGSFLSAAESMHLSQPTLSRQIRDMEEELGVVLIERGGRHITLTAEGMLLRKRAEEILSLVEIAKEEVTSEEETLNGEVRIGAGETQGVHYLTKTARRLQSVHPGIRLHIISGDTTDIMEDLDKGLVDFALLFDAVDAGRYETLPLPIRDTWGVLMRRDSELADQTSVTAKDLWDMPLITSRQSRGGLTLSSWLRRTPERLNIVGTYNLVYNASLMVQDGMGYALCLDGIINTEGNSELCFRPLAPSVQVGMQVVWKKYQVFTKVAQRYLEELRVLTTNHQQQTGTDHDKTLYAMQ